MTRLLPPVLDQGAREDIRTRPNIPTAFRNSLFRQIAPLVGRQCRLDQLDGEIGRRRDAAPGRRCGRPRRPCASSCTMRSAIHAPMDEPTRICGPSLNRAEDGEALRQPFRDRAIGESTAGFAMAGIIVAQISVARARRPMSSSASALVPRMSER